MPPRQFRLLVTLTIVTLATTAAGPQARTGPQSGRVPASVAALLPTAAKLGDNNWGVFDTEFGKTFSANLRATFPGRPISCDNTVGPELRVELKGDTAWEEPPMLDMAVELFNKEVSSAKASLAQRMNNLKASNSGVKTITAVREERLPGGTLIYLDYAETCSSRSGTNTILMGFGRRGATILTFHMWLSTDAAEAAAIGKDILARFAKLDVKALLK